MAADGPGKTRREGGSGRFLRPVSGECGHCIRRGQWGGSLRQKTMSTLTGQDNITWGGGGGGGKEGVKEGWGGMGGRGRKGRSGEM